PVRSAPVAGEGSLVAQEPAFDAMDAGRAERVRHLLEGGGGPAGSEAGGEIGIAPAHEEDVAQDAPAAVEPPRRLHGGAEAGRPAEGVERGRGGHELERGGGPEVLLGVARVEDAAAPEAPDLDAPERGGERRPLHDPVDRANEGVLGRGRGWGRSGS